jgi:hypothetical protein
MEKWPKLTDDTDVFLLVGVLLQQSEGMIGIGMFS